MELNRMLKLSGVSKANFHNIYRRARVIEIQARFVGAAYYHEKLTDGHLSGVFPRDPDLHSPDMP